MVLDGVMDLDEKMSKKSLGEDDHRSSSNIEFKKSCTDCKTTKTPLWRAGPCGPKSLCNACGIRYRKRKAEIPSFHKTSALIRRKRSDSSTHSATTPSSSNRTIVASAAATTNELKMRLIVVGKTMLFQRSKLVKKQRCQRRKKLLGEEEQQAAFSLMALSCGCGSVFA